MALIKCEECAAEISDKSSSCIKCGCPVDAQVQVIEQTAKKYKGQMLAASGLVIISMFGCMGGAAANSPGMTVFSTLCFAGGVVWFVSIRFLTWWNHG